MKLIFAIVGVVAAGAIFFFYTRPAYDGIQLAQAQINDYNTALDKAAELQTLKQSLLSRYNSFNPSDIERLQKLLPDHVDNVRLILDLDSLAGRYGLSLQNVDVSKIDSGKSQTALGAIGSSNQKYESLTLKFSTRGTYANFEQFLRDLETSLRIVDLASLSLTDSSEAGRVGEPLYTYDITLRTYWLK